MPRPVSENVIRTVLTDLTGDQTNWDDVNKAIKVNVVAGGGAGGGTSAADNAAFSPGSTAGTPIQGEYRPVQSSVPSGSLGVVAITETRAMQTTMMTASGNSAMDDANTALRVNVIATVGGGGGTASGTDVFAAQRGAWGMTATVNAGSVFTVNALGTIADNAANPTNKIAVISAIAKNADATWTDGNIAPLTVTTKGYLKTRIDDQLVTLNVALASESVGLATSLKQSDGSQKTKITDGTRDGTVKAASTLPAATDTAVVVTQRDAVPSGSNVIGIVGLNEPATFYVVISGISNAAAKYMGTLYNTSATRKVVVQRIWAYQWDTTVVTGTGNEQRLVRISARTSGAVQTIRAHDSNDTLSAGITADSNSTAVTETNDIRRFFLPNEEAKFNTAAQALNSDTIGWVDWFGHDGHLVFDKKVGIKGITLRQNQGITVKNVSGAVGASSYLLEFSDEAA